MQKSYETPKESDVYLEGYMNPKTCPPQKTTKTTGDLGRRAGGSELATAAASTQVFPCSTYLKFKKNFIKWEKSLGHNNKFCQRNWKNSTIDEPPRRDPLDRTNQWSSNEIMGELFCEARRNMWCSSASDCSWVESNRVSISSLPNQSINFQGFKAKENPKICLILDLVWTCNLALRIADSS